MLPLTKYFFKFKYSKDSITGAFLKKELIDRNPVIFMNKPSTNVPGSEMSANQLSIQYLTLGNK